MTLIATGPAGIAHDPFVGQPADGGEPLEFPADRYAAIGASEQDVADLRAYFDGLTRQERRGALAWHDEQDDEQLAESIERFREARDAYLVLGGLSDEQRAALDALTDEDREALAALTPEQRAELTAAAGQGDEQPPAEGDGTGTSDGGTGEGEGEPQQRFSTQQIGDLTVKEVEALIEKGEVTAADALAAEQARGDDARKTLVDTLTKLTAGA